MAGNATCVYTKSFFDSMEDGALRSARAVLPIVQNLLAPRSIVDIGCGRGAWLRVAMALGVPDILGMDGEYAASQGLLIPLESFLATNLSQPFAAPAVYDLALCLEVAEHLPARAAAPLVAALTAAAPAILFSAAIPGQPGTHHINEQFPAYWRRLFAQHGYHALDVVRPLIYGNGQVEPWYAQNILLYVSRDLYHRTPHLRAYRPIETPAELLPWVYGGIWQGRIVWRGPLSLLRVILKQALSLVA
jgi:hypothetical protein